MRKSLVAVFGLLVSILVVLTVINVSTAATSAPAPGPVLAVTPSGSPDVSVGHFRPGSSSSSPPRVSMAIAMRASGEWYP